MPKPQPSESDAPGSAVHMHLWQIAPIRDAFWIGLILAIFLFTYWLRSIFTPVLIALLLAYIFNPLISYVEERWRVPRSLVVGALVALLVAGFVLLALWIIPLLIDQFVALATSVPGYFSDLQSYIYKNYEIDIGSFEEIRALATMPQQSPSGLATGLLSATSRAFGFIGSVVAATAYVILMMVLIPMFFAFFAWQFEPMVRRLRTLIPPRHEQRALEIIRQMDQAVSGFFRGRLIVAVIMTAVFTLGWWLAGVPYWFLLGFVSAILNIVPYLVTAVWPLAILLKWLDVLAPVAATATAPDTAPMAAVFPWVDVLVWPTAVYVGAQFIDNWFITPLVQSQAVNLSVVTIIIVVLVGGAIGGLYGLLLAIPAAACLKIIGKEVLLPHLKAWAEG